ncbi:MAG: hypothetical protein JSU83_22535 [Deltaproteobacteria bacterium]|nr:MAG: hypothetical protein JSU83_22535 [Deltaproteobacteria bacterium]
MTKKERFQAVREMREPDCMPVWPSVMAQMIYGHGLMLPDVLGPDSYDSEKATEAVLASIKNIGYDVAIPTYTDCGFGLPPVGGTFAVPTQFGVGVCGGGVKPVKTKADWPKVQKMMAHYNVRTSDVRMKGALEVIKNVSKELGDEIPLVASSNGPASTALTLFRDTQAFLVDMTEDPEWVEEMIDLATDWAIDWIRAQYEAGANSVNFSGDCIGLEMVSPDMADRFNFPYLCRMVETIKKEFNQETWIHIHGNLKTPKAYQHLIKLAIQAGVEGFHFDERHPPEWVKGQVVEKLRRPACIITHGDHIHRGPPEKIREDVKTQISRVGDGRGIMMAPSCQILPATSNENFRAWVDATHEYGKYPLQ